jgi:hypothetical protein
MKTVSFDNFLYALILISSDDIIDSIKNEYISLTFYEFVVIFNVSKY